jgi:hypothetical protein
MIEDSAQNGAAVGTALGNDGDSGRSDAACAKRARGAQAGNSNAVKDGRYCRKRALSEIDWSTQLDRRTSLYRELREREERIIAGAGGRDAISQNRLALAQHAAQIELELACANLAIQERGPIDRRRRTLRPLVHERNRLLATYMSVLGAIGLDRAEPPALDLREYIEQRAREAKGRGDGESNAPAVAEREGEASAEEGER